MSNATRRSPAPPFGSQISYTSPDGASYLWFPGNEVVLQGRWTLEAAGRYVVSLGRPVESVNVCFQYGPNTRNACTGRSSSPCIPADVLKRMTEERVEGDIFGLSRRNQAPFRMTPAQVTFADIKRRIGP